MSEEEYLRRAREAQKWADEAGTERARAGWLRVAENWLALIDRPRFASPSADENLNAATGQHEADRAKDRDGDDDEDRSE